MQFPDLPVSEHITLYTSCGQLRAFINARLVELRPADLLFRDEPRTHAEDERETAARFDRSAQ